MLQEDSKIRSKHQVLGIGHSFSARKLIPAKSVLYLWNCSQDVEGGVQVGRVDAELFHLSLGQKC